jgi:hypothetical protein
MVLLRECQCAMCVSSSTNAWKVGQSLAQIYGSTESNSEALRPVFRVVLPLVCISSSFLSSLLLSLILRWCLVGMHVRECGSLLVFRVDCLRVSFIFSDPTFSFPPSTLFIFSFYKIVASESISFFLSFFFSRCMCLVLFV